MGCCGRGKYHRYGFAFHLNDFLHTTSSHEQNMFEKKSRKCCYKTIKCRYYEHYEIVWAAWLLPRRNLRACNCVVILAPHVIYVSDELQAPRFITQPSASGSIVAVGRTKILQCQALGEFTHRNLHVTFSSWLISPSIISSSNFSSNISLVPPITITSLEVPYGFTTPPRWCICVCCYLQCFIVVSVFSSCCFLRRLPPAPVPMAEGRGLHLRVFLRAFLQDPERAEEWRGPVPVHRQEQRGQHPQRDDPPHRRLWVEFLYLDFFLNRVDKNV